MEMRDEDPVPEDAAIAFYRFETELPADASIKMRIFRWLFQQKCPNYEHCQFSFTHGFTGPGEFLKTTWTTTKAHPFAIRDVKYHNKNWEFYRIALSPDKRRLLFNWCKQREHTPFNWLGFYWNFFAPCTACTVDKRGSEFFCAEMVIHGLRLALPCCHALWELEPYLCTVDDLHDLIERNPDVFRPFSLNPIDKLEIPSASHAPLMHTANTTFVIPR